MKPSEFLDGLDSHGIYKAAALDDLDEEYRECVPQYTYEQARAGIVNRGLGGDPGEPTEEKLIYGYSTAAALARRCLDEAPSNKFHGRGFRFRADRDGLREAGF